MQVSSRGFFGEYQKNKQAVWFYVDLQRFCAEFGKLGEDCKLEKMKVKRIEKIFSEDWNLRILI